MNTAYFKQIALALSLTTLSVAAHATANTDRIIYGTNFGTGSSYTAPLFGGTNSITFSALANNQQAKFSFKAGQGGYQGVGVSPKHGSERTPGEIDIGESINATIAKGSYVTNISLGLLFDGPEYGDVNETAQITATYMNGDTKTFTLTATGQTTAVWSLVGSGVGSFAASLSPAKNGLGGAWSISDPFGGFVKSFSMTAISGSCGSAGGACNNQSDFTLISIAVPEPETYAMMLAGLAAIGFIARRKKQA